MKKAPSALKQQVYCAVDDLSKAGPVAKAFGVAIFVLIVVNALLVFVETQPDLSQRVSQILLIIGFVSSVLFGIEYFMRMWVADMLHPEYTPARARIRYALSPMGIIDALAFIPGLLVLFVPVSPSMLNAICIVRLIRLMKLSRYMSGLQTISRVFRKCRHEIIASFAVLALLTITASVLMFEIEYPVQPDRFDSVFTGMYWAMTTITSTGYGDLVPLTALGRLLGFWVMVLSIGVVAIPGGIFSAGFVAEFRAKDAAEKRTEEEEK